MERPSDLFDRVSEWQELSAFATGPGPGIQLALVRGRRRQGKSFMLRRLAEAAGGFYFQAVEEERSQALTSLGSALGEHLEVPGGRLALENWDAAVGALSELPSKTSPTLVVLDEFPYLLAHSPELPSVLQRAIDKSRDGGAPLRVVLCGSALSAMAGLLTGTQALRGRASLDVVVRTFDVRTAAGFWEISDPTTAFLVNAVLGGTPGYRDLLPAAAPKRPSDVAKWLAAGPLNPASALFREDDYLLTEERSLPDRALYHSVITAIAEGHTSQATIAAALGREQRAVQHPLTALEQAGFVSRTDDALRSRRPIYRLADPIVRFHHVVTRRDLARFEERRTVDAWSDAQPRFATHVLGPHFEEIAREFTFRFAAEETVGGRAATVGPAVVNDSAGRTQHEIDVVVLGRDPSGAEIVLSLGEAKHTTAKRTLADLQRLERVRGLVADKRPSAASAKLLLFSASGFDHNLINDAQQRHDVELIDLVRIYGGE
jgi:AAA+ ATPase superfamily predicted ATPase